MVCNVGISTRSSECSGLKGMIECLVCVCRVWRERLVLVYADGRCVGWYAGGFGVVLVERWSNGRDGSECYVSVSMGRRLCRVCCVLLYIGRVVGLLEWRVGVVWW